MPDFMYKAEAVDSRNPSRRGMVTASNAQDAEEQVKALFAYPVKVTLNDSSDADTAGLVMRMGTNWEIHFTSPDRKSRP